MRRATLLLGIIGAVIFGMAVPANATVYNAIPPVYHFSQPNQRAIKYELQMEALGTGVRADAAISCLNNARPRQPYRCTAVVGELVTIYKDNVEWTGYNKCGVDGFPACDPVKEAAYSPLVSACGTHQWQGRLRTQTVVSSDAGDVSVDLLTIPITLTVAC